MLLKTMITLLVLASLFCLFYALRHLFSSGKSQRDYARMLTWRIGICLALFVLLFIGFAKGWIQPHGLPAV